MKKALLLLALILSITIHSQQKKKKKVVVPVSIEQSSDVTKNSKWIEKFKLKGNVYNVYLKQQKPKSTMQQIETDTLIEYQFVIENRRTSIQNIQKYATVKGKIGREGFYKIKGDTLITIVSYYDPYHGGILINKYVPDKYGWLTEVKSEMKAIDTDSLSDRYIKTEEMNSIYMPEN